MIPGVCIRGSPCQILLVYGWFNKIGGGVGDMLVPSMVTYVMYTSQPAEFLHRREGKVVTTRLGQPYQLNATDCARKGSWGLWARQCCWVWTGCI